MVECHTIGITLTFITGLVTTPLVGLALGVSRNQNVQLRQWVKGKAAKYTPPLTSLDACGGRKRFKEARQKPSAPNLKTLPSP